MTYTMTMTCKPFSSEARGSYSLTVDAAGIVRVYDDVAKHYTTAHQLSPRSQAAARTLAGWEPDVTEIMAAAAEAGDLELVTTCAKAARGVKSAIATVRRVQSEAATACTCAHWCEGRR